MGCEAQLYWKPESIAEILSDHGVRNRSDLAERLSRFGIHKTTVYRAFTEDWDGRASTTLLAALAVTFAVPLTALVVEPFMR